MTTHIGSYDSKQKNTQKRGIKPLVPKLNVSPKMDVLKFLTSLREFSQIPSQDLVSLAEVSRMASYGPGEFITHEGEDEGASGFIVVSGLFAMLKTSTEGKELIVELLQAGDNFGMLLTLAREKLPSQLSARAMQKSSVLWLPIQQFMQLLKAHPILFKDSVAHLLLCLHSSYGLSRGLAHDKVEVRIAAVLQSLAIKFPKQLSDDAPYTINFTRQQLADLTGTTPETAIRVTRAMQREGLIDIQRPGVIRITDLKGLQALVDG